jgi:hypothetical protein
VNTIGQETENRHTALYSELLSVMFKFSDVFGHRWVEVIGATEIRLHSRYRTTEGTHEITQVLTLETLAQLE